MKKLFGISVLPLFLLAFLIQPLSSYGASVSVVDGRFEGTFYVSIVGQIEQGDFERIRSSAATAIQSSSDTLSILLDSPGGDVAEAMKIGKWLRELMAKTHVYGSHLYTPGTPDGNDIEESGRKHQAMRFKNIPIQQGAQPKEGDLFRCFSACVLIFYGGVDRYVSDNIDLRNGKYKSKTIPIMGLHRPYYDAKKYSALNPTEAREQYVKLEREVKNYLTDMGAPPSVIERMFRKASNQIDIVSDKEFESMYQTREPFFDEWLIAKCGASGASAALDLQEQKDLNRYEAEAKAAAKTGRIKSAKEIDDFVPSGMHPQRIKSIFEKIATHYSKYLNCESLSVRRHQTQLIRK
jgi:hypothetical protein